YTKEHEWVKVEGSTATIGVTEYAAEQLGDIVYAELPAENEAVTKDETFGALESVKAVSDCYSPVTGKVVEINDVLAENPETVNEDPYGDGWMVRIEMSDPSEAEGLMDHKAYAAFVAEESK
ncbi:MAG TPA: glycine cleavage system protein GcvH, partial [bacterium]|nr:glycine cleavage system protein GcvH [bacterium]